MRGLALIGLVVVVLTLALVVEAIWDSAIGGWVALGAVFAYVAVRLVGAVAAPDWWPFDGEL